MREDSPVLNAIKNNPDTDLHPCRWCGTKYHMMTGRFTNWGANGFCSAGCKKNAEIEYDKGNKDWWKTYHPKP